MEYNLESFQAVGKIIDLQNHKVTVLGHCNSSSFAWLPGRWWISAATDCSLTCRKQKVWSATNALPLSLSICLYSVLDEHNFFSPTPWVVCRLLSSASFLTQLRKNAE